MTQHDNGALPPPDDPEARVAALAREGRERQAAALAADAAEERRAARRQRREVERLGRANVRNALLASPPGPSLPILRISIAMVCVGTLLLFAPGFAGVDETTWRMLGLALLFAAIAGFFGGRLLLGPRYVRREAAWLGSLPFPVRGYFRILGETPSEERQVRVRIRFRHAAPEREVLEGIVGLVQYPATAVLSGGSGLRWTVTSATIRTPVVDDVEPDNMQVLGWMRGMIGEVLVPLHEAYPLRGVTFDG
ncbi:MAG TPA: hypothetical protein VFJ16_12985 [Longimicrobium sp.]|nr:hypothetical protein [Longimicrobium sp.]